MIKQPKLSSPQSGMSLACAPQSIGCESVVLALFPGSPLGLEPGYEFTCIVAKYKVHDAIM